MSMSQMLHRNDPIVWVRRGRGGPGYGERAVGRFVRMSVSRLTVDVYRQADECWVLRSIGPDEIEAPTPSERVLLEELEARMRFAA